MRQQMNVCVWVVSWNESAQPWRFYTVSGSELLKAAGAAWMKSQYAEMKKKKNYMERGKQCPAETCWGTVDGPGCFPLQSKSFTQGNIHRSAVSRNKLSIDFNRWTTTKVRVVWSRGPWVIRAWLPSTCSHNNAGMENDSKNYLEEGNT